MLTEHNIVPSDLFYALNDLNRLTKVIRGVLGQLDYNREDGTRIEDLDTISSLMNITDERIEQLAEACLRFDTAAFDQPKESYLSDPVRAALKDFEEKEAVFRRLVNKTNDTDDCENEFRAKEEAEDVLIRTPCLTLADVRAKAQVAIDDENVFDSITNCRNKHEHVGKTFLRSILGLETKL